MTSSKASTEIETKWPGWPDGEEGKFLLDVVLDLPVNEAFLLIYGGLTDLKKTLNEAVSNKEYSATAWMEDAEAVQTAALDPTPPPLHDASGLRAGMLRRASYSGTMMGSKYRNEELHRLLDVSPGSNFRLLTTVLTTAMHGEKFRPVVESILTALPDGRTAYRIRTTIIFVIKPNGFIKTMIDRGARDGQRKNFEALRKVLEQYTTVTEAGEAAAVPVPAGPALPQKPAAKPVEAPPAAAAPAGVVEAVVGAQVYARLDPWAAFLHGHLAAAVPLLGDLLEAHVLLAVLAVLALLSTLHVVIDMLLFIHHASDKPHDTIGFLTHYIFKVVDVPDSMQEVLVSCLIFYAVRLLVNRLAAVLPAPPAAGRPRRTSSHLAAAGSGGGGSTAEDAAVGSPASVVSAIRSEEQEGEGIKYEGYAEAIAAAQVQALSPKAAEWTGTAAAVGAAAGAAAGAAVAGVGGSKQHQSSFMKGFKQSITGAFNQNRIAPYEKAAAATAAATAVALATETTGADASNKGSGSAPERASENAAERSAASQPAAARGGSVPPSAGISAATSPTAATVPRSQSESAAAFGGMLPAGVPSSSGPGSPPGGTLAAGLPQGAPLSPTHSPSPMHASKSQEGLAEQSGHSVTALARKLKGVLSPSAEPGSPQQERKSTDGGSNETGPVLSPSASLRDFRPGMPAHLAPELRGEAVIEECFENQRLQPFRGWGHTWPGHFLPTDKVNRWSRREHENFPVLAGSDFQAIAPPLPEGWQWCEEKWHVDLSGQIIDACDSEGWSYGLDFAYVRHPFQQHSGKKKMSDFVRRRRWIRTRVPLALAAQRRSTAIAQDRFSWSEGAEVAPTAAQLAAVAAAAALENAGDLGAGDVAREVHTVVESIFAQVLAREQMQQALTQQIGSSNASGHGSPAAGQGLQPGAAAAAGSEQQAALPADAVAGSHGLAQAGAPAAAAAAGQQQVAAHSSPSAAGGAAQLMSPSEQLRAVGRPGKLSPGGASPTRAAAAADQPGQQAGTATKAPLPHPAVLHQEVPAAANVEAQQEGWPVELAAAAGELAEPGSGGGPPGDDDSLHLVAHR
ncbi:hypothetical protein ACK3TF_004204 [Chlorella vulgaris]